MVSPPRRRSAFLLHGDDRPTSSPALRRSRSEQCPAAHYDIPNGRFRAPCKDGEDLRRTGGRRCSDRHSPVLSNRGDVITHRRGRHEQFGSDLSHAHRILSTNRGRNQTEKHREQ
jgi:hypothetical protein